MLIPKWKVPKWRSLIWYLLHFLFYFLFLMLHFFRYKWNVLKKLKTFLKACFFVTPVLQVVSIKWEKGRLSGLRQFLATESSLKMVKNAFYFTLKAFFILKIFKFLYWLFGHAEKCLIKKISLILKIMTSQPREKNNCNTHIAQYLKYLKAKNEICSVNRI